MFIIFLFLVMALILYFLFSPITYSLDIRLYEKKRIVFRLGDVLRLFSLRFVREDENVFTIELFFGLIKIHPKKKKKEGEEKGEEKNEEGAEKEKTIKCPRGHSYTLKQLPSRRCRNPIGRNANRDT